MFAGMVAMVAVVTSPTTAGCSVMYCNCSCSCSVVELGWDDNVHVPVRTQARQPHHTRAGGGSLSLSLPGGPFWPLSSPNPPKRTSPAWSGWLCSLLSLWWSVLAAQQPESFKTDLPSSSTGWGWGGVGEVAIPFEGALET